MQQSVITHVKISVDLLNRVLGYITSQPTNRPVGEVMQMVQALQQSEGIEENHVTNEN